MGIIVGIRVLMVRTQSDRRMSTATQAMADMKKITIDIHNAKNNIYVREPLFNFCIVILNNKNN